MNIEINKIYCENCIETMARMPDGFINLTVTSPPYDDMDLDFNPIPKNGMRAYNGYSWNFKKIAQELYRVTKTGGVVVWVVNDPTINGSESLASSLQKIYFRKCGFNVHDTMIYQTSKPPENSNRYQPSFEYMFVLSKSYVEVFNQINIRTKHAGEKVGGTFWKSNGEMENRHGSKPVSETFVRENVWRIVERNGNGHPAAFPESLARDHIYSWSNEGDLVYDPFMGSGTTAKMAHLLKRNWIGSEISSEYCELARKRIDPYLRQTILL